MDRTRVAEPPISAELWARLRKFDVRCEISIQRTAPVKGSHWSRFRRVWVVTMRPYETRYHDIAQHSHPRLGEALRQLVEEAERRKWDEKKPPAY